MPAHTSVAKRFEMFDHTVGQMGQRLLKVRAPAEMMSALRWGMDELDATYAGTSAKVRATVACRDGCDFCCRVPVDVQAHEVFFAANHIQVHFSPAALLEVIDKLAAHRVRVAALAAGERATSRSPCALLVAGSCSVYAGRPEACRSHHTSDAAVCEANMADPAVNLSKVYIPALRARMFAVMLGLDEAIEAAGYDERSYDFGSALHEALTNSLCLMLWMRRQSAFPDSCLADAPPTG
ncbi:MAG: putative zinc-or iron-chelating protein [Lacunisphaera sp.]|nr:putative zinc-or iron-chelating protein [Lacunisphaera sp.]